MDEDTNFFSIKIPVICVRGAKAQVMLVPDFHKIPPGTMFSTESIRFLKKSFGVVDEHELKTESELKRKLELMLATGKYSSKTELAKAVGFSDSYVCRVLKHHS